MDDLKMFKEKIINDFIYENIDLSATSELNANKIKLG